MVTRSVGSSDVAVILGMRPFVDSDPVRTWARCIGASEYDSTDDPVKRVGRVLEAGILQLYHERTGAVVHAGLGIEDEPVQGPEPWMHSRPDGYRVYTPPNRVGMPQTFDLECKTAAYLTEADGWGEDGTDLVPTHYLVQCIWHMACTGHPRCDLIALGLAHRDLRVYHVWRDEAVERTVVDRCRDWYERYVLTRTPPPITGNPDAALRALAKAYPAVVDRKREATYEALRLHEQLVVARDARKRWAEREAKLKAELCTFMGEADTLVAGREVLATWKHRKGARRVDVDDMRRRWPDLVEAYTRTGEPGRTFRLKE